MPKADNANSGMDYLALDLNAKWPAQKGQSPRHAGQFGHYVKIRTQDGRLEARIIVRVQ